MLPRLTLGLSLLFMIVPLVSGADYYGDGTSGDISYGIHYDDNVSRAQNQSDIENDFISTINGRYGYQNVVSRNSLVNLYGDISYQYFHDFENLNNLELAVTGNYLYQTGSGFFSPWIETSARISHKKFQDSKIRDSYFLLTSATVGKRFSEYFTAQLGYQYEQRFSRQKIFDLTNHTILTDLEFNLTGRSLIYTTYTVSTGDKVSTAIPNATIIAAADRVAPDDVFAPGIGPGCLNRRCAYRLDGITQQISAGLNFNILNKFDIDLSGSYHHTDADGDNRYRGFIYGAGIWLVF